MTLIRIKRYHDLYHLKKTLDSDGFVGTMNGLNISGRRARQNKFNLLILTDRHIK